MTAWKCQHCGGTFERPDTQSPRQCTHCRRKAVGSSGIADFTVVHDDPRVQYFRTKLFHILPFHSYHNAYCGLPRHNQKMYTRRPLRKYICVNCVLNAKARMRPGVMLYKPTNET